MQVLDWIILAALTMSMLLGAWRGLVYEVLSVLGWAAAFILAQWFAPDMAQLLPMRGAGEAVRYAAGFVLVFVLSVFVAALLARLAKTLFSMVGLQPVDRILGAVFGLVRGTVLVLAAAEQDSFLVFQAHKFNTLVVVEAVVIKQIQYH